METLPGPPEVWSQALPLIPNLLRVGSAFLADTERICFQVLIRIPALGLRTTSLLPP